MALLCWFLLQRYGLYQVISKTISKVFKLYFCLMSFSPLKYSYRVYCQNFRNVENIIISLLVAYYRQIDYICLSKSNNMAKEELRKSIYRIFSDLVKQDNLITIEEIQYLDAVCHDYDINDAEKVGGHMMTLADAMSTLQGEAIEIRKDVLKRMAECAIKDNECCRDESLLLTAFKYCCVADQGRRSYVRSFPAANIYINDSQLIYLENESSSDLISSLMSDDEQYSDLCDICRLGGFDYIYIPKVAEHFRSFKDRDILKDIISLVSPSLKKNEINSIIQVICGMSTTYFYKKVLRDRLQLPIRIDRPIWMFKVGNSVVGGQDYANFLCVEVADSAKTQLRDLMNEIMSRQSSYHLVINKIGNEDKSFEYDGFYRTLLDMMAIKKVTAPDIVIHTVGNEMLTEDGKKVILSGIDSDGNVFPIVMDRREASLYVLLLCACAKGGRGIEMSFIYNKKGEQILKNHTVRKSQYDAIYNELSNWASIPDITSMKILRPARSYISKSIKNAPGLSPQALYIPIERNGYLMLSIEADHIKVLEGAKEKKLLESDLYASYRKAAIDA